MAGVNTVSEKELIELGKILKKARTNKQLTTRALAEIVGTISSSDISLLENAKRTNPNPIILKNISEALGLNYLDLFLLIGYINKNMNSSPIPYNQEIKIYESISTERGKIIFGKYIKTIYLPFTTDNYIGIVVNGDSMEPKIPDGSIAIIDIDIKELENRNVGAFIINEESCLKRVIKDGNKQFLMSDNNKYPPIFLGLYDEITLVGKVVNVLIENF